MLCTCKTELKRELGLFKFVESGTSAVYKPPSVRFGSEEKEQKSAELMQKSKKMDEIDVAIMSKWAYFKKRFKPPKNDF